MCVYFHCFSHILIHHWQSDPLILYSELAMQRCHISLEDVIPRQVHL